MLKMSLFHSPEMVHIFVGCDGCNGLMLLRPLPLGAEHEEVPEFLLQGIRHVPCLHRGAGCLTAQAPAVTDICRSAQILGLHSLCAQNATARAYWERTAR